MLTAGTRSLRRWGFVHKWTSLICTLFMLLLCITGLPLIFHERDRRPPAQPGEACRCSSRYAQRRSRPAARQCVGEFVLESAAFSDLGSRRSQRDVRERRRVHHFRPHEESLRPHGCAYRRLSRFARRHRPLYLHHAEIAHRHVRRFAGQAVPWIDGDPVLRRHHIRHRRLCAVDAEARLRHLP